MSNIVEMGFSVSHEFDGGRVKHSLKKTTIKEWLGDSVGSNVVQLYLGDGGYEDITIGDTLYEDAKIISQSSNYEGDQHFKTTVVEQKIDGADCEVFAGLTSRQIESYSDSIRTSKKDTTTTVERTISLQLADLDDLETVPESISGSALLDLAISKIKEELDAERDCEGENERSRSESIDEINCSVSVTDTEVTKDGCDDNCSSSKTESVSIGEDGVIGVSISGDISGLKRDYICDDNGNRIGISKSKYDYALECFEELDIEAELNAAYEESGLFDCDPEDYGLTFRITSKTVTHCEDAGTISWSASGSEQKPDDGDPGTTKNETTSTNGCVSTINRSYSIEYSGEDARDAFAALDFSPPDGYFGPIGIRYSEGTENATASMTFTNDPKYDVETDGVFKSIDEETTVCKEQKDKQRYEIPCGSNIYQNVVTGPGYTRTCKDVQAFPCATSSEIMDELAILPDDAEVVLEETFTISISSGSKSANSCVKYHTADDLNECD